MSAFVNYEGLGEGLPGTGSIGGSPVQHNYKRAVVKPPPRIFSVQALPPVKIGSGFCYGLRIYPMNDHADDASSVSGGSRSSTSSGPTSEYEVWRRWEDCLWFQELLELEYGIMARTKRQRLAAGKGVKKDGVYIHSDQAASFDSLPPGPEAKSIAKDIHDIIPKLSKKGTLFRPSQSTIEQRSREFQAMIATLFSDDIPTLIKELRDSRVIRDFFGYWRRDKDHDRKAMEKSGKARTGSAKGKEVRSSIASSAFSMYFASNISVQMPGAYNDLPPSPTSATSTSTRRRYTETPTPLGSGFPEYPIASSSRIPATAPPKGAEFTLTETGSIAPMSMIFEDDRHLGVHSNGLRSAPVGSTSTRPWSVASELDDFPIMFIPPTPEIESEIGYQTDRESWAGPIPWNSPPMAAVGSSGLEPLPEDQELVPDMSRMSIKTEDIPPARRPRAGSDRARNRNCMILGSSPLGPTVVERISSVYSDNSSEDMQSDASLHQSLSIANSAGIPTSPNTNSSSSRHSSVALSSFDDDASWRTSIASDTSVVSDPSTNPTIDSSCTEIDKTMSTESPSSPQTPLDANFPDDRVLAPRASIATMNSFISNSSIDAIIPKGFGFTLGDGFDHPGLRRSLSAGGQRIHEGLLPLTIPEEDHWYEHSEEFLDASFYDPSLLTPASPSDDGFPESPSPKRESTFSQSQMQSSPPRVRSPRASQARRYSGYPRMAWSPPGSTLSLMSTTTATTIGPSSILSHETFTIKAMKDDVNVLLRVSYSMEFREVREKIREKFQVQEGIPLSEQFAVAFVPPSTPPNGESSRGRFRPRSSSTSSVGLPNSGGLQFIQSEYDWVELIEGWTKGKLTLRIFDRN